MDCICLGRIWQGGLFFVEGDAIGECLAAEIGDHSAQGMAAGFEGSGVGGSDGIADGIEGLGHFGDDVVVDFEEVFEADFNERFELFEVEQL